jgi:hypothetical protein
MFLKSLSPLAERLVSYRVEILAEGANGALLRLVHARLGQPLLKEVQTHHSTGPALLRKGGDGHVGVPI